MLTNRKGSVIIVEPRVLKLGNKHEGEKPESNRRRGTGPLKKKKKKTQASTLEKGKRNPAQKGTRWGAVGTHFSGRGVGKKLKDKKRKKTWQKEQTVGFWGTIAAM